MAKGFRGGGFGGKGAMGGMRQNDLMKQAQKMQEEMLRTQEELENRIYTSSAGGGAVTAEVSGKRLITSLTIDPEAVDPEDVEMLQDMIVAAVNEALRQVEEDNAKMLGRLTGGMPF
jgi:DNA-binding YbaB/EbfC family protein